jgi:hypothetical protein
VHAPAALAVCALYLLSVGRAASLVAALAGVVDSLITMAEGQLLPLGQVTVSRGPYICSTSARNEVSAFPKVLHQLRTDIHKLSLVSAVPWMISWP